VLIFVNNVYSSGKSTNANSFKKLLLIVSVVNTQQAVPRS